MARPRKNAAKAQDTLMKPDGVQEDVIPVEEQPYPLPEGWKWVKLGDTAEIVMGQSPSGADTTDDSSYTPLIGGASDMGQLYPEATKYTKRPTKLSNKNDIIVCIRATLGRPIFSNGEYCLGRGVAAIRSNKISSQFTRFLFINFEQYLYDNATGTTFAQVNSDTLKKMHIPLPPVNEQQRIVDRIESLFVKLDEAKEKAEAVLDGFESRKAAILHKAFTGELTAKWREEKGVKKESWQFLPFDKCISNMQNGISKRKGNSGRDYIVLRLTNLVNNKITLEEFNAITLDSAEIKKYSLNKNDILMIRVNGSKNNIGKQFMVEEDNKYAFCDHIIRIKYDISKIDNKYAFLFSQGNYYKYYVQNNMVSSAGQNTISRKGLANLEIPLPTIPEQKEITRLLESLLEKEQQSKEAAQTVLEQIDLMKKAILARAFRGELMGQVHG